MEPRRCQVHGLVLTPEGQCVICMRGREQAAAGGSSASSGTYFSILIGILLVGGVALAAIKFMGPEEGAGVTPATDVTRDLANQAGGDQADETDEGETEETAPPPPRARPVSTDPTERPSQGPSAEDLKAEMQQVKITMYSTSWCDVCKAARRWMNEEGLQFTDLDVEKSETDKVLHRSLNPRGTVPTFDVEGTVLVGFDRRRMMDTVKQAAEKHLE
jgi:glutaredoxin